MYILMIGSTHFALNVFDIQNVCTILTYIPYGSQQNYLTYKV